MTAPNYRSEAAEIDGLLNGVGEALELTLDQRRRAQIEFANLGRHLSDPGTLLGQQNLDVYPQGSTRIGTEVRPLQGLAGDACEHDLDAVVEAMFTTLTAMEQYEALHDRLAMNLLYRPYLERKNRCVRINFPGEFHLDALPAKKDWSRQGTTSIQIPDRKRNGWVTSNPKGYAAWFETQGALAREAFAKAVQAEAFRRSISPLPTLPSFAERPVLNRVVQLMKRRRDIVFKGTGTAPRSIILTTLAGRYYDGEVSLLVALMKVVRAIGAAVDLARPNRIEVRNPTDERENFADAWGRDGLGYQAFVDFIHKLEKDLIALSQASGIDHVVGLLEALFGAAPVQKAYHSYREEMRTAGESGTLRVHPTRGLVAGGTAGLVVPRSTHFGSPLNHEVPDLISGRHQR